MSMVTLKKQIEQVEAAIFSLRKIRQGLVKQMKSKKLKLKKITKKK